MFQSNASRDAALDRRARDPWWLRWRTRNVRRLDRMAAVAHGGARVMDNVVQFPTDLRATAIEVQAMKVEAVRDQLSDIMWADAELLRSLDQETRELWLGALHSL